ncbi:hypothetical protein GJV85_03520 [Sulfurimonas aquatica]|uniref:Uncharacterized protein n=1 Tax=Sulfurimonas aquatica TaxID=2672570 RepID=A0A975AZ51_9BACT|nr:hypothetical protein [Sulfurimonas aquatica]QSZ41219.1 hypothetical protein GJV85_03520 [Sulfurimonas aquatica]
MNNTITLMVHSQNFDVAIEDEDFIIFLAVTMQQDFKNINVSRLELLNKYVSKVYELYQMENELDKIMKYFPQS